MRKIILIIPLLFLLAACGEVEEKESTGHKPPCLGDEEFIGQFASPSLTFNNECKGTLRKIEEACEIPLMYTKQEDFNQITLHFFNYNGEIDRSPNCLNELKSQCEVHREIQSMVVLICRR